MFGSTDQLTWDILLQRFRDLVDDMQSVGLATLSGEQELDVMRDLKTQLNRMPTVEHRLIADIGSRGTAHEHGCTSTANLLTQLLRISPNDAAGQVRDAANLGPRRELTGEPLPPLFEQVAAAQACGAISASHARIITRTIDALPDAVADEHEVWVQQLLVEQAHTLDPQLLAQVAHRIRETLDPDGILATERDRAKRRELRIRRRTDGSAHIEGELTAICAEALLAALEPLAAPVPAGEDGAKDPRTAGQRLHDALQDAMLMVIRSGQLPDCGGFAATILLTITQDQFATGTGLVATGHGALISVPEALTLFGDSRVIPVVLGKARQITAYGTSHRIFTEGQRLAMIARDQGCSFPACTKPPSLCQAHHVTDYSITRRTCVDDGTLVCGFHHREHPNLGWTCRMINGIPHWTAPRWTDPTQTPRRNRAHHLLNV